MNRSSIVRSSIYSFLIINTIIIVVFWWLGSSTLFGTGPGALIAIGRLVGLLAELTLLVQLVLIGRIKVIEQEYGFDNLNRLHRTIGYSIIGLLLIHPTLILTGYAFQSNVSLWQQFLFFIQSWEDIFKAVIGLALFIVVISISVAIIRRKLKYETWYFSHLFIYLAIFLVFGHQVKTADVSYGAGFYYWYILNGTIFGLVIIYRFIRPILIFYRHRFYVEKVVEETPTIFSVYIKGKNIQDFQFQAGQYATLTFIDRKLWTTHPFSFSAAQNGEYIRFSIKSLGDYTRQIPYLKPGTHVHIDGPFGVFTAKKSKRDSYLLIAGGIGITPLRALCEELSKHHKDVVLIYAVRNIQEIAFLSELRSMPIALHILLSDERHHDHAFGYVTLDKIAAYVPDYQSRECYICGPKIFMEGVVSVLKPRAALSGHIHYERFSY